MRGKAVGWHARALVEETCVNEVKTREDGAGQRFPHGSQLLAEELTVCCNLDLL